MKIILRIIVILLVASVVAGAFSLAVNNGSTTSSASEGVQLPPMTDASGQSFQPIERFEGGDRDGGSIAQGLPGVLVTLAKLTGVGILVLAIQRGVEQINQMKLKVAQR